VRRSGTNNNGELQTFLVLGYHTPHQTNYVTVLTYSV